MIKKILGLVVAVVMILGVLGLVGCNNVSLADYKVTKSNELQAYADAKGQSNYCDSGWTAICRAVTDGKAAIEEASSKPEVDTKLTASKNEIDRVVTEDEMAEIVSIHFFTTKSFIGRQSHQFYDFAEKTYSTKTVIDDGDGEQEDYAVKATFTDEQITEFFINVKKQGLFSLKDTYSPSETIYDGNSWNLEIQFKDGKAFNSSGYVVFPDEAIELDKIFLELSGFKLFGT